MILPLQTPTPSPPPLSLSSSLSFHNAISSISTNRHFLTTNNTNKLPNPIISISISIPPNPSRISSLQCRSSDIDMVQTSDGAFVPKQSKVVVLWDLDNKPPRGPPYEAALALRKVAERFGLVVDISAYANRHAFSHLPSWVVEQRRERRRLDVLERKGMVTPSEAYVCNVCGRKCKTHLDLKKHFKQLHERERQKKLSRMKQLKGKKRQKFKERYLDKNYKFEEGARDLITPKVGYGLARELRRAGVFVKTVEDKPQAADWALKRQMMHSLSRGIDWLFLVSDDSDFKEMLGRAREANLGTVVVGDQDRALGRHADLWVPWIGVEKGEVSEKDLVPKRRSNVDWEECLGDDSRSSISGFDGSVEDGFDLDRIVDELVLPGEHSNARRSSFFFDEEEGEWDDDDGYDYDDDDLSDSEDEFEEEDR